MSTEIDAKIVLLGLEYAGKTSNLSYIFQKIRSDHRSEQKTYKYDVYNYEVLPIELGEIKGCVTRFKLYTLPGKLDIAHARRELANQALGIIFVVDSQHSKIAENQVLYREMVEWFKSSHVDPRQFPVVIEYNKLDLPTAAPIDELEQKINILKFPFFKTVAIQGTGVLQALSQVTKGTIRYAKQAGRPLKTVGLAPETGAAMETSAEYAPAAPGKASGNSHAVLNMYKTGPAQKNQDGSFSLPIYLRDPHSQRVYLSEIQLVTHYDGRKFVFKIATPEE